MNVATGTELKTLIGAESTVTALTFDPDNNSLFSGEEGGTVRRWDALSGIEQFNFKSSFSTITALAFSASLRFLAIGDEMGKIRLFDFAEEREKYIFTQHTRKITSLVFAENSNTLVSGSEDGTILLWDMNEVPLNIEEQNGASQQDHPNAETTTEQQTTTPQNPQQIAKKALESTVYLAIERTNGKKVQGSGFFVRPGYVATNYHVIVGAAKVHVNLVGRETAYSIQSIVATDEQHDLALLKVADLNSSPLPLGNSNTVQTGETIYVIGNPEGLEGTFSKGIVSGIRRDGTNIWIQIDAPISPGSSGGAVLNSSGQVIGIATAGHRGRDAQNLNFAVPSNYLKALLSEVR